MARIKKRKQNGLIKTRKYLCPRICGKQSSAALCFILAGNGSNAARAQASGECRGRLFAPASHVLRRPKLNLDKMPHSLLHRKVNALLFAARFLPLALVFCLTGCAQKNDVAQNKESEKKRPYYEEFGFSDEEDALAFPGADGYGKNTVGGRGGKVIAVTNLNDSGDGSLRAAIEAKGARVVVFKVSGTIELESMLVVKNPYITIAGQTAPGDGICIANYGMTVKADQVIVRYLRSRPGGSAETDALWVKDCENVVIDHVSASWGTDETLSVSGSDNVTVSNCLISESLNVNKFGTHGMGSLVRGSAGQKVTFARNVYATHRSRLPMAGNYSSAEEDPVGFRFEFINNLVYNWSGQSAGKNHDTDSITWFNLINNDYRQGPVSAGAYAWSEGCSYTKMYMEGNSINGQVAENQWDLVEIEEDNINFSWENYKLTERFEDTVYENILPTSEVYDTLLADVGASLSRDQVDQAVIETIKNKTGKIINKPEQSAGWSGAYPDLQSKEPQKDSDGDGMPDEWEEKVGLDASNADDGALETKCGYTNLDIYLHSLLEK